MNVTAKLGQITRNLLVPIAIVILILAASFAIYSGALWLFDNTGPGAVKEADRYPVLRDVLAIALSASAIFITVFGTGAYFFLRRLLTDYVTTATTETYRRSFAASMLNQGFALWSQYQATNHQVLLDQAIDNTNQAYEHAKYLDESKLENEELICSIRNNWAWYLAAKANPTEVEKRQALWAADYLEKRLSKFPNHGTWVATIDRIRSQFAARRKKEVRKAGSA